MYVRPDATPLPEDITVNEDVAEYIERRGCDFRICTSCGGPILLPISMKPPKSTDLKVRSGNHTIYISIHQARYLHSIHRGMLPAFLDHMEDYSTGHEY